MLALDRLLEGLLACEVRFVVVGGVAVGVHRAVRVTEDLGICPDPDPGNLGRLATLLGELHAAQVGAGDFDPGELLVEPTDPAALAAGGNFGCRPQDLEDLRRLELAKPEGDERAT